MKAVDYQLEFAPIENKGGTPVVIVAAGSSQRMNGIDKQFAKLCGVPVLAHTLLAFERCDSISKIIVVTSKNMVTLVEDLASKYLIGKLDKVTVGGATRFESVVRGLECIKEEKYALVHDGARPLVSCEVINRVCSALPLADAVVCTTPVNDTIKIIGDKGDISTLKRDKLLSAQTPQAINIEKFFLGAQKGAENEFTDDVSVLEKAGYKVISVDGDFRNIKITRPEDLELAQFYLERRGVEE